MDSNICVILHGGAGRFNGGHSVKKLPVLKEALDQTWDMLADGAPGENAVARALSTMEGSQYFNAGYGGYPNADGIVLLDVGLMRGTREFISLINVRRVKYPSLVACDMLDQHRHLISTWTYELEQWLEKAEPELQERYGLVPSHEDLISPNVREMLDDPDRFELINDSPHGTVGCVVRDLHGNIHAGTSTGGVSMKTNGRVGDTPIIGSGVYADNEIGGLSTTGNGEAFLLSLLSGFIIAEMRRELRRDPTTFVTKYKKLRRLIAVETAEMTRKSDGKYGAVIVVPKRGNPAYGFNSEMVSLAMRTGTPDKVFKEYVRIAKKDGDDIGYE